ncbi:LysR family transcriptional regulator ArgP [Xenorhabdus sp. VLS]|uniref:LysR family transcriptional regulator ArgP n=1 Tax=Xenorhabdus lircayensis TaxID=2763499 RepID=A0ABS0U8R4_9GAMM|nr:LysR family transcriptional regulator ArgP [Xenorhabdus lircayensis]MBI6550271.1 LysR family transcriptional regulator ArgP [Xenorhabdus lircayensis]
MAIIETGSFEQAARRLNITPSAISQRIKSLEAEVGVPIVRREHPCTYTSEGFKLVQYLIKLHALNEDFKNHFYPNKWASFTISVNNDSLADWLLPAISCYLSSERVKIEIIVDDQDFTHIALESGNALGALSSRSSVIRGCSSVKLGSIRYRLLASKAFVKKWFKGGVKRSTLTKAPLLVFNKKDLLQHNFLAEHFLIQQESCICHYIPGTDAFYQAVKLGVGYGMIPDFQSKDLIERHELVDLLPRRFTDIALYWHYWPAQSNLLGKLTSTLISEARKSLHQD